jgi:hypothetical protein
MNRRSALCGIAFACAAAVSSPAAVAKLQDPLFPIHPDTIAMSGSTFISAFAGQDEELRHASRLYFLGLMDATERTVWCDYKTMKTITVREHVYLYFKKLPAQRLSERASTLIVEALGKSFPRTKGRE